MDKARINRLPDGTYFVSDHNDERINIIAQILSDKKVRNYFYEQILHLPEVIQNKKFDITSSDEKNHFEFNLNQEENFIIKLTEEAHHKLNTDIRRDTLKHLINKFEELINMRTEEIVLTREQDNFKIEAAEEH